MNALRRGRAYLEAGAECVFVPMQTSEALIEVATIRLLLWQLGRAA